VNIGALRVCYFLPEIWDWNSCICNGGMRYDGLAALKFVWVLGISIDNECDL